jgi:hypothetical protein
MPFQPAPDIAQFSLYGRVDGQTTINDLYFAISGGTITPAGLAEMTDAVAAWWGDHVIPLLSEDWAGQRVVGVDLTTANGARAETARAAFGGESGEAAPNNVAMCVKFLTAFRGRSFRGRNFVPGVPNSQLTLNTLAGGLIDNLLSAYGMLIGPGTLLAGWEWVVLSRITAGDKRPNGVGSPVVAVAMTTNTVRSMRTREVGVGA